MEHVVLFGKVPRLGAVKTRLTPPFSDAQALALHEAMLLDQIDFVRSLAGPQRAVEIRLDGPLTAIAPDATVQGGGSLGARMARAIERSLATGARRVAILGADAPSLPRERLEDALALVRDGAGAALVPALDGGYVVVAAGPGTGALFDGIPWGSPGVLEATRARAASTGVRLAETAPWGDVDRASDLPRLDAELRVAPGRAPRTAAWLAAASLYDRKPGVV